MKSLSFLLLVFQIRQVKSLALFCSTLLRQYINKSTKITKAVCDNKLARRDNKNHYNIKSALYVAYLKLNMVLESFCCFVNIIATPYVEKRATKTSRQNKTN